MTWTKFGSEFIEDCASVGLTDAAFRTHTEAIAWIYTTERTTCKVPKHLVKRFAESPLLNEAIRELVEHGWWRDAGSEWQVVHHEDVIRQSLAAQVKQRDRSKKSSRTYRERHESGDGDSTDGSTGVTGHVTADVTHHADRQTDKHLEETTSGRQVCKHWVDVDQICDRCKDERKSA